jgi:type VI secretion system secreted protein VgrG
MATFTQLHRPLRIKTPLGGDTLLLERLRGEEHVSGLFQLEVELLSEKAEISPADLLGQPVTIAIDFADETRHLSGIVSRFAQAGRDVRHTRYRAVLVPKLWLASLVRTSRIFQSMSVRDIASAILGEHGIDHQLALQRIYQPRNYCVQYRETNLDFLSRLLEEEGIHYFHVHSEGGHQLVLSDASSQNPECPGMGARIAVAQSASSPLGTEEPVVFEVERETSVVSGKVTAWDHNFQLPGKKLDAEHTIRDADAALELYDYPGGYAERFDGIDRGGGEQPAELQKIFDDNQRTVGIRADEVAGGQVVLRARTNCPFMVAGHRFTLGRHFNAAFSAGYVLTSVQHEASIETYESSKGSPFSYSSSFTCIPADRPYVPPQRTPRPRVEGAQTAIVVGPAGTEIFTDKYGRVKVQFHWDRQGKNDSASSCWVRVGTVWAGKQWGAIHIPRVGQEVIVDFLEGDPDRPIIVGSVYNPDQMPPYALPDNATQSGIKSRSSPQGTGENYNEIRMEDKKGSELLYIHAEKDKEVQVENDRTESVGANETITIGSNRTESVGADESVSIGENQTLSVGASRTRSVAKDETITITGQRTMSVGKSETISVDQDRTVTVAKNNVVQVGEKRSTQVGKDDELQVGKRLLVNVNDEIVLKTGQASITMKKDGTITIKGKDITITGSGKVNVKASSDVTLKGSQIKSN